MSAIQTTEPSVFVAGDTLKFKRYFAGYPPADGWVLSYALVMDSYRIGFSGSDNGDGYHLINVSASNTKDWKTGQYRWQAYVSKGSERYSVASGEMEIQPDFASRTDGYDARSHVKQVLDALEAVILKKASKDQLRYSIAGMTLEKMSPGDLIRWHNHYTRLYRQELEAERIAQGLSPARKIQVRF